MPNSDSIQVELKLLEELAPMVTAKQEIAVSRIQEPQKNVLASRQFFERLSSVFGQVRDAYQGEVTTLEKSRRGNAVVLFSAEQYLTGPITSATFRYFIEYLELHPSDPIVIGSVGKQRFISELPGADFNYIELPKGWQKDEQALAPLVQTLLRYKSITFVFGQYANLVSQRPTHVTIGDVLAKKKSTASSEQFVFEPSLETIVSLFDRNLVALLFKQAADENTLAELGSQITAMELADNAIRSRQYKLKRISRESTRQMRNKQQRERLSGLRLWSKR
ncbi:MAG: F0F1 ATP synthase subunit gamma [Candidatus Andersenbacteria bacterium]|nr:F0F1 ATP synthase subunit gamma [Candidatus Andersenbacteria bacterium]MBI3250797.1 F0F1 ATP synthase subunit gamma [Candidatus Andersenbacteria bacterium]